MPDTLNGETLLYPILGDPVALLKSPQHLSAEFQRRGHNGLCVPMRVERDQLELVVQGLSAALNVRGLLITMPHKYAMLAHCATASAAASMLGAVSLARRNGDGSWHGDMLDGQAFVTALRKGGAKLAGARVFQVGAGGAGSAIAHALIEAGVAELALCDTAPSRCDALVRILPGDCARCVGGDAFQPGSFDIVVNATPLGMSPDDPAPIAVDRLMRNVFVGDVIAGHGVTRLLQAAQQTGCKTVDGSQMVDAGIELMCRFLIKD